MICATLSEIFQREISKIQDELLKYEDPTLMWKTVEGISNSGGNLALHVAGNLQHFIGATLGNNGYVRNRELEFSTKNISVDEVIAELGKTSEAVKLTFDGLDGSELQKKFPINVFGQDMTTEWFLLHLVTHTSYHLGQINYHRRLVS